MGFIDEIKARAKADKMVIVLPETEDERTYKAAETVLKEGLADLVLVGSKEEIEKNKGTYDISGATIVDPATDARTEGYIAKLVELRQKKGMTPEQAKELLLSNYLYYGVMMAKCIGCILPLLAKKIGLDPAIMAAPLITTILDTCTILVYFNIVTTMFRL